MRPAWSVILLTTLIGAGQGLFLAAYAARLIDGERAAWFLTVCSAVSVMLLGAGLAASFFHLGRPLRAWRAASQWRTSWLSREVLVLPAFAAAVAYYGWTQQAWAGVLAVLLCLALFACTGMIYACLKFLQEWHSPFTLVNFLLLGAASGATLATAISVFTARGYIANLALAALWLSAVAYLVRCASLARNAALRPKSTTASAIGPATGKAAQNVVQKAQGFMGGSFNTREFFHGRPDRVVRVVRWTFLMLLFPVPALLLGWGGTKFAPLMGAFLLQFIGLLAERWYFFAEAKHPQNLYYQSMA
jgi:DMSO reductase anchor subunit